MSYAEGNFFLIFSLALTTRRPEDFDKPNIVFISENAPINISEIENLIGKILILSNQLERRIILSVAFLKT
ncbi:MAG: hypothetical protein IPJ13_02175 [Saprospiraceae bacterium]|nr:hypothetical protein [Saprospiraceae bacterium]